MLKIAIISHDASRTGAPILLINLIRLLKETGKYEFFILLKNEGELQFEFSNLGETVIWNKRANLKNTMFNRLLLSKFLKNKEKNRKKKIIKEIKESPFILNNTITNGEILSVFAKGYSGKIITYIHELAWAISIFTTPEAVKQTIQYSDKFIVPSNMVKRNLEKTFCVPEDRISIFNSFLGSFADIGNSLKNENASILKIGGCGTADWRKGFDIFLSVVIYLKSIHKLDNFLFTWKGVFPNISGFKEALFDIEKAGLSEKLLLLPSDKETDSFYKSINVFFLSSREDPYPLVVLEAATYNVPTVCFEEAGGAPEFVQSDAGFVVSYLDIRSVANVLLKYEENRELLLSHGRTAKSRVEALHQDKNLILEQFEKLIQN
jgi:glycosyltransferase involved in cell wall biosynthesis